MNIHNAASRGICTEQTADRVVAFRARRGTPEREVALGEVPAAYAPARAVSREGSIPHDQTTGHVGPLEEYSRGLAVPEVHASVWRAGASFAVQDALRGRTGLGGQPNRVAQEVEISIAVSDTGSIGQEDLISTIRRRDRGLNVGKIARAIWPYQVTVHRSRGYGRASSISPRGTRLVTDWGAVGDARCFSDRRLLCPRNGAKR
jgi:hypothetical protein